MRARPVPVVAVLVAGLTVVGCGGREVGQRAGRLRIVASIFPLADAARQVGGERVEVTTLLPAGRSPHGYQLKPRQVEAIAEARLLLTVGLGLDIWAERALPGAGGRPTHLSFHRAVKVEPIAVEHLPAEGSAHHRHAGGADPHLWLDPVLMGEYVGVLGETLAGLDPAHAADYRRRAERYRRELADLDREYRRVLSRARRRAFVSFHSAFTYLARRYGLEQVAVFEAGRGGLSPRHLEEVVDFIRRRGIRVVFAEPQFPRENLRALQQQTGVRVATLDPLGNPAEAGYDSYLALMRTNLRVLARALEVGDEKPVRTQPTPS